MGNFVLMISMPSLLNAYCASFVQFQRNIARLPHRKQGFHTRMVAYHPLTNPSFHRLLVQNPMFKQTCFIVPKDMKHSVLFRERELRRHLVLMSSSASASSSMDLKTVEAGLHVTNQINEVNKSKFIGYVSHVTSYKDALITLDEIKTKLHPKARHWCHGYIVSNNSSHLEQRSNDDGEPAGTGGQPILSALQTEQFINVICVVVRYYGGIQLGTGGLIRAYGRAAQDVLRQAPTKPILPKTKMQIKLNSMQFVGAVFDLINNKMKDCMILEDKYYDDGSLSLTVEINESDASRFKEDLNDVTRGKVFFIPSSKT